MEVILIILSTLAIVGLVLWIFDHFSHKSEPGTDSASATDTEEPEVCCGMHITCEKDSLLASVSETIDYFDDEELDRFCGREADQYEEAEIEEFRDVLLTLRPDDIAPWARSIQLRGIKLPASVKDELLMIVAETRAQRNVQ
ncbi:phospholipase [uncultured Muribaculum sp.]|uniref:phospholipase n=1 Tax=uncultured Muribaculum sp. TaxID=1918613 RepID=UPI0025B6A06B|nr:phospholipase [uncultured Muribaculum sp.]